MKKSILIFLFLALSLSLVACSAKEVPVTLGNKVFGTFSTTDLSGKPATEQIFQDKKLTMVNIWATFCNPCIKEMPELAELHLEYGDSFQVIGIVVDAADRNGAVLPEKKAEAEWIAENTGANYLHLLPSPSLNRAYLNQVQSVPETVFLDEEGNQIGASYLGARSKAEWKEIIDALLESAK